MKPPHSLYGEFSGTSGCPECPYWPIHSPSGEFGNQFQEHGTVQTLRARFHLPWPVGRAAGKLLVPLQASPGRARKIQIPLPDSLIPLQDSSVPCTLLSWTRNKLPLQASPGLAGKTQIPLQDSSVPLTPKPGPPNGARILSCPSPELTTKPGLSRPLQVAPGRSRSPYQTL